jgi:hypothetical protein
MKRQTLRTYPMMSDNLRNALGLETFPFRLSCNTEGTRPESNNAAWPGPVTFEQKGNWTSMEHNLAMDLQFRINNPAILFGNEGIACQNAEIAAVLEWSARKADQRGLSNTITFGSGRSSVEGTFSINFEPGQIAGKMSLDLMLYINTPDPEPKQGQTFRANSKGLMLGPIAETCTIEFDGEGSIFPVTEFSDRSAPLWRLFYDVEEGYDALESTSFEIESVCLEINTAHQDYMLFKNEGNAPPTPLAKHVFASWLTLLFLRMKEKHGNKCLEKLLELPENEPIPGTVASVARFILRDMHDSIDNACDLSVAIHSLVHSKMTF